MEIPPMQHLFATFNVTRQVFFQSKLSIGIVNLKPLLPGHVLLIPKRVVPRLSDLHPEEVNDLFLSVQQVGRVIERVYEAQALTISLQDGKEAGQSVPHVHIHLIPRRSEDFAGNKDEIYPLLERAEHDLTNDFERKIYTAPTWSVPADADRKPRNMEEMEKEASYLASFFVT